MTMATKSPGGSRRPLRLRPVGHALLIHPKGEPDQRALAIAERLVPDPTHHVVVIDLPPGSLKQEWEAVARLLADRPGAVRFVHGRRGREDVQEVGQRLADRLGRPVLLPDGEALSVPGGRLYIPSEHGVGWLSFRPGQAAQQHSRRFPKTHWEFGTPDRPVEISPYGAAEPMPSGVWVHSTADLRKNTHRQRLTQVLPTHPDILTVVIGSPGAPEVPLEDVTGLWESLLPTVRPLVRFVHYGAVALPDGRALGQALADELAQEVVFYSGVPVQATFGLEPPETRLVRSDGWLSAPPFAEVMTYVPTPAGQRPTPPRLYGLRTPLPGLRERSYGVYDYAPDAVLEIVQSGLWMRPAREPVDGDGVRSIPAEPGVQLLLFDRGGAESAERMRSLAEDALWRLDPEIRGSYRIAPADAFEAVRAAARAAMTWAPAESDSWTATEPGTPFVQAGRSASARSARGAGQGTATTRERAEPGSGGEASTWGSAARVPVPPSQTWRNTQTAVEGHEADEEGSRRGLRRLFRRRPETEGDAGGAGPESGSSLPPTVRALMESGPVEGNADSSSGDGETGVPRTETGGPSMPMTPEPEPEPDAAAPSPVVRELAEGGAEPPGPVAPPGEAGTDGAGGVSPGGTPEPSASDPDDGPDEATVPDENGTPASPSAPAAGTDVSGTPVPGEPGPAPTAGPVEGAAARPARAAAPRVRLESGAPDEPGPASTGGADPVRQDPRPEETPSEESGSGTPESAEPPTATAPPRAVRVQPVPETAACAVPPTSGLERERSWLRRALSGQYNAVESVVSGIMAESPGLRGRAGTEAAEALTELVAVRLYLFGQSHNLDAAVRGATVGPHVPLARCVASGLRRLPSYRGAALLHARLGAAERAWYREGRLATEWAFCTARTSLTTGPAGSTDLLIWSLTARRTNLIDPGVPDRVLFLPGTNFKVLRVHPGERPVILLRELSPSEIAQDGRVGVGRTPLDEIALNGLEQTLKTLTGPDSGTKSKAPTGPLGAPPGLLPPVKGPAPGGATGQDQLREAPKK